MFGTSKEIIKSFVTSLRRPSWKTKMKYQTFDDGFDFKVEYKIENFLGVETHRSRNKARMRQLYLIDRIIGAVGFTSKILGSKPTPSAKILFKDESGVERKYSFNYHSLIGMLNYLDYATMPCIMMLVRQCAHFCKDSKLSYEKAVKIIIKCLIGTKCAGIEANIDLSKGLIKFTDSDFENGRNKIDAENIHKMFSRVGHIIFMFDLPVAQCIR